MIGVLLALGARLLKPALPAFGVVKGALSGFWAAVLRLDKNVLVTLAVLGLLVSGFQTVRLTLTQASLSTAHEQIVTLTQERDDAVAAFRAEQVTRLNEAGEALSNYNDLQRRCADETAHALEAGRMIERVTHVDGSGLASEPYVGGGNRGLIGAYELRVILGQPTPDGGSALSSGAHGVHPERTVPSRYSGDPEAPDARGSGGRGLVLDLAPYLWRVGPNESGPLGSWPAMVRTAGPYASPGYGRARAG